MKPLRSTSSHLLPIAVFATALLLCCAPQMGSAAPAQTVAIFLSSSSSTSSRLTYRAAKAKAKTDKQRKGSSSSSATGVYQDLLEGWRVSYPEWCGIEYANTEAGFTRQQYSWTRFQGSAAPGAALSVAVARLGKQVTTDDLEKDFANYSREPVYDEEFRSGRYLVMPEILSSVRSTWQQKETLVSTFTHRNQSRTWKVRQIRIPAGNRIFILEYAAIADRFDRYLPLFESFRQSFGLLR